MATGPLTDECVAAALEPDLLKGGGRKTVMDGRGARAGPATRVPVLSVGSLEWIGLRAPPWTPYVLGAPLVALLLEAGGGLASAASLSAFFLGGLLWTLIEYLLHRFAFHGIPGGGPVSSVVRFIVHLHHHRSPRELTRLVATPVQIASVALPVWALLRMAAGSALGALAFAGFLSGYLVYEAMHHAAHHGGRGRGPLRPLFAHHRRHHFETPDRRWGISSPLWDWVFGTL